MTDKELMQQALEALETGGWNKTTASITALRERLAQPQMQPCAGRNCGSTNPNLHSAECFEDYEKATGMAMQEPVAWMFEDDEDNGHKTFRQTQPSPEAVAYLAKWNRPAWVPIYEHPPASKPLTLWTEAQHERAYRNSPELHKDVKSLAAFKRVAKEIAAMYGIKGDA